MNSNVVNPESCITMLNNIVDNIECGQQKLHDKYKLVSFQSLPERTMQNSTFRVKALRREVSNHCLILFSSTLRQVALF